MMILTFRRISPRRFFLSLVLASYGGDCEDPYPSLSDFHDYEPNLEFDDSDLQTQHPENDDGKHERTKGQFQLSQKALRILELMR